MPRAILGTLLLGTGVCAVAPHALAQMAVASPVAQAVTLQSEGKREAARRTLSDYLALRPDDRGAWLELGRAYLADARSWFLGGRRSEPHGILYLDFASTALEQAYRLGADSAAMLRNLVEMDRAAVVFAELGAEELTRLRPAADLPRLPGHIAELGQYLTRSCPANAVIVTGNDVEAVAVWHATFVTRDRPDLLVLRPDWYINDPVYRRRMASQLDVDRGEPLRKTFGAVAARRQVCLTPFADMSALPRLPLVPNDFVRSTSVRPAPGVPATPQLALALRDSTTPWAREVREVYVAAAAYNPALCSPLAAVLTGVAPAGCRR